MSKCTCDYSLGMGPNLKCPVHGDARPSEKVESRAEFEAWLSKIYMSDSEWIEERNCYKDFPVHMAWQAWRAAQSASAPREDGEKWRYDADNSCFFSDDFKHDAALKLSGDFADEYEKTQYAAGILRRLVSAPLSSSNATKEQG